VRPLSSSEILRMAWSSSSLKPDLKFIMKLSLKSSLTSPKIGKNKKEGSVLNIIILGRSLTYYYYDYASDS
jgi:hypothetical protein